MANDKEVMKKLLKIAEKQQKIIEKLAQQVMPAKATAADFDAILKSVKKSPNSTATVTSAEALSDGSYDIRMTGFLTSEEMQAFKQASAGKYTNGDVMKLRIIRDAKL